MMNLRFKQAVEPEAKLNVDAVADPAMEVTRSSAPVVSTGIASAITTSVNLQRRYRRLACTVPVGLSAAVMAAMIGTALSDSLPLLTQPGMLLLIVFGVLFVPLMAGLALNGVARRLSTHTEELAESGDTDSVGPLIDLLAIDQQTIRRVAGRALTRMLPSLTDEDASILTAPRRQHLIRRLRMNPDFFLYKDVGAFLAPPKLDRAVNVEAIDLRVAILDSYARVGGALELPTVRQLAESTSPNPAQVRLREAARVALPAVEARAARESDHGSLLRVATSQNDRAVLLQPAGSEQDDVGTLLLPCATHPADEA
jgi:hypothetical protein